MIILDPSLKREKTFHENKFSLGEDFYHRYKYEPLWRVHWKRKFKNIYAPLRKLEQDTYILNIGAGTGPVEFFLSKKNKNFNNFISTDISINAIQNLKYLNLNNNLLIHNAATLPFKNNSFDVVLFIGVLHHIPEDDFIKVFHEVRRIIKPHGFVIASEPMPNNIRKIIKRLFYSGWKNRHSDDEREVRWIELECLKNELQLEEMIIKPFGLFMDLLINIKINRYIANVLQYLYILDIIVEKLHIGWSYFIYIKFRD